MEGGKDPPKGIVQTLRLRTPYSLTAYAKVYHSHHKTFWEEQGTSKLVQVSRERWREEVRMWLRGKS